MKVRLYLRVIILVALATTAVWAGDGIPKAAWRRPLGLPLEKPGVTRIAGNIDDGFWQGAPVGGFGSGTFSRTYRGDFARWHMKAGVHKYAPVYANQFAMFQQVEGEAEGTARVLMTDHPADGSLASWQWDYPVGAGSMRRSIRNPGTTTNGINFQPTWCSNNFLPCCPIIIASQAIQLRFTAGMRKIPPSTR